MESLINQLRRFLVKICRHFPGLFRQIDFELRSVRGGPLQLVAVQCACFI